MFDMNILNNLPYDIGMITRQVSAENPTGDKGGGCNWEPNTNDPNA